MEYWRNSEWRLGLFIACGLVLFGALVFTISNLTFFDRGYEVRVLFRFASGVEEGAPVRLAGVKVGEVKNVKIVYDFEDEYPLVEVHLNIQENVRIRQDASILISTLGLLGEKYVEILPGTKEKPLIESRDIVIGYDTVPLAKLSDLGYQIALKLDQTIDVLREIFVEEEQKKDIKITLNNIKDLSANLNNLVLETDVVMKRINRGEGTLGQLISEEELYDDFLAFVKDIKRNPWKLLRKTKSSNQDDVDENGNKGYLYSQ
ncbi:MAG: MlaD family protein [Candidatus Saelkia tenebricola]|nr:MlaD family protein [Candidatus Saelkia tenebricola]